MISLVALVCVAATLYLAWRYPHGQATDGYSYVDIADLIADGRLRDAVNGYWSVLLPVMLAPWRFAGASGIVAYTAVSVISVLCIVWFIHRIGTRMGINPIALAILSAAVGLRASLLSMEAWTPDVLFTACGLAVTALALSLGSSSSARQWLVFGLASGGLYYVKPVGLYTGLALCVLVWIVHYGPAIMRETRHSLRVLGTTLAGFALAVTPWIVLLSLKYGYLTTGYSGKHNLAISALKPGELLQFPRELWHRPFEGATSYSNDYTYVGFELPYSMFSPEGIRLVLENTRENVARLWDQQPILIVFAMLALVGLAVIWKRERILPSAIAITLGSGLIQLAIYVPILIEHRYLLLSMSLVSLAVLGVARNAITPATWRIGAVSLVVLAAVMMMSTLHIRRGMLFEPPLAYIQDRELDGARRAQIAQGLDIDPASCSRIAAHWGRGGLNRNEQMEIAHRFNWFNAGAIPHDLSDEEIIVELQTYDIDCVLVWNENEIPPLLKSSLTYLGTDTEHGVVSVYQFDPPAP